MGVTIHYTATLKSPALLPELFDEIEELSDEAGWDLTHIGPDEVRMPDATEVQAEGFLLSMHEQMEPVNLIFDSNRQMINFAYLLGSSTGDSEQDVQNFEIVEMDAEGEIKRVTSNDSVDSQVMARWASTKTQFAGPEAHIGLCKLLQYLSGKYFKTIEVEDEGEYWQSGEAETLILKMNFLDSVMDDLELYLKTSSRLEIKNSDDMLEELKKFWSIVSRKKK